MNEDIGPEPLTITYTVTNPPENNNPGQAAGGTFNPITVKCTGNEAAGNLTFRFTGPNSAYFRWADGAPQYTVFKGFNVDPAKPYEATSIALINSQAPAPAGTYTITVDISGWPTSPNGTTTTTVKIISPPKGLMQAEV